MRTERIVLAATTPFCKTRKTKETKNEKLERRENHSFRFSIQSTFFQKKKKNTMPDPPPDEKDEAPIKALDEDDIALLTAYGAGPYAAKLKAAEAELKTLAKRVDDACGVRESDTGLAPPSRWDLVSDKQAMSEEQPLQVRGMRDGGSARIRLAAGAKKRRTIDRCCLFEGFARIDCSTIECLFFRRLSSRCPALVFGFFLFLFQLKWRARCPRPLRRVRRTRKEEEEHENRAMMTMMEKKKKLCSLFCFSLLRPRPSSLSQPHLSLSFSRSLSLPPGRPLHQDHRSQHRRRQVPHQREADRQGESVEFFC